MGRRILLGVTGSIAAYKAAELVRLFVKNGDTVNVMMTPAACEFVKPLTFQTLSRNPVYIDQFAPPVSWEPVRGFFSFQPRLEMRKPISQRLLSSSGSYPIPAVPSSVRMADIFPFFRFSSISFGE